MTRRIYTVVVERRDRGPDPVAISAVSRDSAEAFARLMFPGAAIYPARSAAAREAIRAVRRAAAAGEVTP